MRVAQINENRFCYAVSDVVGDVAPEGTIAIGENENPICRILSVDGVWSEETYLPLSTADPAQEITMLKKQLESANSLVFETMETQQMLLEILAVQGVI